MSAFGPTLPPSVWTSFMYGPIFKWFRVSRCGAGVTWKGSALPLKDYNALPVGDFRRYKVAKVDATDAGINEAGFMYFAKLEELEEVVMKNCQ